MSNPQQSPKPTPKITLMPAHAADLPVSEEAEDAVLGSILRYPERYYLAAKIITDSRAFFYQKNSLVWDAIAALVNKGTPIDSVTLVDFLTKKGAINHVGSALRLTELVANTPPNANIEAYAEIVNRLFIRRQIIQNADELKSAALDETIATEAIEPLIDKSQVIFSTLKTQRAQHISVGTNAHVDMVVAAMESPGNAGINTGLRDLDDLLTGLHKRKLIVVGGLSHHGKTALLLEIALNAAQDGANVALFNVADGDDADVMNRLATMGSGIPSKKLVSGDITPSEYTRYIEAMGKINKLPIYLKSEKGMSPGAINNECKTLKDKTGNPIQPDIIIIDYIQRMYLVQKTKDRRNELMVISQGLTKLADEKHFNCPVAVAAQLRMDARKNERPGGHDVQESKDIYQDCDVFITVFRESLVNPNSEFPNSAELIVDKNKQTGEVGTINVYFDKSAARFFDGNTHDVDLRSRGGFND
jgi:replicative DNA helicase